MSNRTRFWVGALIAFIIGWLVGELSSDIIGRFLQ